jgi:hypothetical protein
MSKIEDLEEDKLRIEPNNFIFLLKPSLFYPKRKVLGDISRWPSDQMLDSMIHFSLHK